MRPLARASQHKVVLCIQDTTELDDTGKSNVEGLGPLNDTKRHGLRLHPTVMVTPERVPLRILDARFWTHALEPDRMHRNQRPIEDKESFRWLESHRLVSAAPARLPDTQRVSVGDREGDIYEPFAARQTADQPQAELLSAQPQTGRRRQAVASARTGARVGRGGLQASQIQDPQAAPCQAKPGRRPGDPEGAVSK